MTQEIDIRLLIFFSILAIKTVFKVGLAWLKKV
jgi:hypothetical protein